MAGGQDDSQKTEEPSQKRLDDAQKKGDVVKSQEISTLAVLVASTAVVAVMASGLSVGVADLVTVFLAEPHAIPVDGEALQLLFYRMSVELLLIAGPVVVVLMAAAILGNTMQHRFVFTAERMKPALSKISPLSGLKKMFGLQGLVNFLKGIFKIVLVGSVVFAVLWPERDTLFLMLGLQVEQVLAVVKDLTLAVLIAVCAVYAVLAVADFSYQKFERHKRLRMTKQEVKDEHKQAEGDPHVKAKLRQIRSERSRQRMMAAVPEASVVITNPTHYAVALKYESGTMDAPICVAKGVDAVALRIREVAREHDVPIVENPPLARVLHASVEIEDPVPPEHYKAVAQVIGYVWRLRGRGRPRRRP